VTWSKRPDKVSQTCQVLVSQLKTSPAIDRLAYAAEEEIKIVEGLTPPGLLQILKIDIQLKMADFQISLNFFVMYIGLDYAQIEKATDRG